MAKDFKASQVRTSQIIVSSSLSTRPSLMVLSASSAGVDFNGSVTLPASVGKDVFVFVSGSTNSFGTSTRGVTLFGGDIVISGTAYNSAGNAYGNVAGSNKQVQFNDGGVFGANSGLIYDKVPQALSVGTLYVTGTSLNISGNVTLGDASADTVTVNGTTTFVGAAVSTTFAGDIAVNGGDITTTATTVTIFNTAATTLNLGGAADVNIGGAAKTTTVAGALLVNGNLTVKGTTTAVSSSNLTIADPIVYIASGSTTANTKSAIAFASGSSVTNQSLIFGAVGASNILAAAKQDVQSGSLPQLSLSFTDYVPLQASSFLAGGTSAYLSSSNGSSLELAAATQVLVLSGGASTSINPRNFADANFFVSGSAGSRGSSVRGTAVFGGDVVISGTAYNSAGTSYITGAAGSNTQVQFNDGGAFGSDPDFTYDKTTNTLRAGKFEIGGANAYVSSSDGLSIIIAASNDINISAGIEGLKLRSNSGPIALSGSDVRFGTTLTTDIPPQPGADSFFFVSGSTGLKGSNIKSIAVFGGDVVYSGSNFGGVNSSLNRTLLNQIASTVILDSKERQLQSTTFDQSDIFLYVSGAVRSKGTAERGTAVFGGDVVLSGSLHGDDNLLFITSSIAALATDRTGLLLRQGNGSASITLSGSLNNPGLFGDSIARPFITTETTNQNIAFVLKGGSNTRVEFIPDDNIAVKAFISGSGYISGTTVQAAALSGSLTKLKDGTSYLIAGSNVTITTGSSGAVTIASTGGGGGGGDSFFTSTTQFSIFTTGSTAFVGTEAGVDSPQDKGVDVFFYVSGSKNSKDGAIPGVSMFGGDLMLSGSTYIASGSAILPVVDRGSDLGSSAKRWGNVYTGDLHLRNDRGDWTIVEEEDYLCVVNNKTGKKFKMALIPLEE